ncbi:hypothetical protein LXA43DRAFT_196746 [Ganoderma leucocontextum]|nr:hypothetical protein LXA43DRAFT_196746 [Ganoderma leucocontextum]
MLIIRRFGHHDQRILLHTFLFFSFLSQFVALVLTHVMIIYDLSRLLIALGYFYVLDHSSSLVFLSLRFRRVANGHPPS